MGQEPSVSELMKLFPEVRFLFKLGAAYYIVFARGEMNLLSLLFSPIVFKNYSYYSQALDELRDRQCFQTALFCFVSKSTFGYFFPKKY